jgi:hypothetical protein
MKADRRGRPAKPFNPMERMNQLLGGGEPKQVSTKPRYIIHEEKIPYRDSTGKMRYHMSRTKTPYEEHEVQQVSQHRSPLDFGFGGGGGFATNPLDKFATHVGEMRNPLDAFNAATGNNGRWRDPLDFRGR